MPTMKKRELIHKIVVIGAGISGCTIAERYANQLGKRVLVIEKRAHIGGNCYDYTDSSDILVPKYGPHFFHTSDNGVWRYINKFSKWKNYEHKVLASVKGLLVPVPVNINTVNILYGEKLTSEDDMKKWLWQNTERTKDPQNSEDVCLQRVGRKLYEDLFKNYTKKQWDLYPSELSPEVLSRIPVRLNYDDRYFTDAHQAMPRHSYTKLFENMLQNKNIEVRLNSDYMGMKGKLEYDKLFITGPIDRILGSINNRKLQYRTVKFENQTLRMNCFQPRAQINYPNDNEFTRITEPKIATGQKSEFTTIIREYSYWGNEEYYPVHNNTNLALYNTYKTRAEKLEQKGIYFVGRLANFKYFNMDQAFRNALETFYRAENINETQRIY